MTDALHLLASGDPTGTILATWGAPGAIIIILGLFSYGAVKRERDRGDRLEKLLQETNERIAERFHDTLKETRDALKDVNDYLRDLTHRRR